LFNLYRYIMAALVGFGDVIFDVASGRGQMMTGGAGAIGAGAEALALAAPSVHYTIVFNTFVFMQLVNQINCRKVNTRKLNVLEGRGGFNSRSLTHKKTSLCLLCFHSAR
jgi:hypothetical protein